MPTLHPFLRGVLPLACLLTPAVDAHAQDTAEQFFKAIRKDDARAVEAMLNQGVSPQIQDKNGTPAIVFAAGRAADKVLRLLLEKGADPKAGGPGNTPLAIINLEPATMRVGMFDMNVYSCRTKSPADLVRTLFEKGADINASGNALRLAAGCGHLDVVSLLLDRGADVTKVDGTGETVLHRAVGPSSQVPQLNAGMIVQTRDTSILRLLIERGAAVNVRGEDGDTPLVRAVKLGLLEKTTLLLERGADANVGDDKGDTPLILAARMRWVGDDKVVAMLLTKGANRDAQNAKGETAAKVARGAAKKALAGAAP